MLVIIVVLGYVSGGVEKIILVFILMEFIVYIVKNGLVVFNNKL